MLFRRIDLSACFLPVGSTEEGTAAGAAAGAAAMGYDGVDPATGLYASGYVGMWMSIIGVDDTFAPASN